MPIDERLDEIEAQVLLGIQDNITGLVNLITHPINTAKGLFQVVLHPVDHAKRGLRFLYNEPVRAVTSLTLGWLEGQVFNCTATMNTDFFQAGNFTMVPAFSITLTEPITQAAGSMSNLCVSGVCQMPVAAAASHAPGLLTATHSVSLLPAFQAATERRATQRAHPDEQPESHSRESSLRKVHCE